MAANMIAARQKSLRLLLLSVAATGLIGAELPIGGARAVAGPVITNWRTGLAIHGFDPVAYFADGRPLEGRPDVEFVSEGMTWRFRSEANRAAFAEHPEIYRPRFGGYDPVALTRSVTAPGNPLLWLIHGSRLYFFHTPESRAAFAANPVGILRASEATWPNVEKTIVP